ncbi:Ribosomal RNA small subunit methyltransferase G [Shimia thalassica]|uniref:Ribosomal RNA small subunit methyltransferase G n=2 Tax=Shimia thalassica TaxID=1715693 RepID=A0A0P1IF89_9RHOB|nr:Ribosomal RNA small subunit methyltransferase G [Shimia thalassica]
MMNGAKEVLAQLNVSRETSEKLLLLSSLLEKWNPKINLVSKSSLKDLWMRHILDSAQIYELPPENAQNWVDIGSGGGFPGLVIAILSAENANSRKITLIESDQRKCAFLRTVLRETEVPATVLSERIEKADPQRADVLSARALADLSLLFEFSERHLGERGIALFPKGATWQKEVKLAQESWSFKYDAIKSKTEPEAVILKVGEIRRV